MKTNYQILIIGGGNGGLSVPAQLLLKNKELEIAILDPSENHYYQPAWTLVGGGVYDIQKTVRKQADLIPKGAVWLQEAVDLINPEQNSITCKSGLTIKYAYLVAAPGIQLDWGKIKGLKESLGKNGVCSNYTFESAPYTWQTIKKLGPCKAIFTSPNTPIKCGGARRKLCTWQQTFYEKKDF